MMRTKRYRLKNYIAQDLLHTFIELRYRVPDLTKWKDANFSQKDSLGFKYNKLMALFRALEIPWDPEGFIEGRFIDLNSSRYDIVIEKIKADMSKMNLGCFVRRMDNSSRTKRYLMECFNVLLEYRQDFERQFNVASGVMAAPPVVIYAYRIAMHFNDIIRSKIDYIENILLKFISPEEKNFTSDQLKNEYGYPDSSMYTDELDEW